MIFITVGTHEQGMDRLLIEIDRLIENNEINDEVFAQIGYSEYKPKRYAYKDLIGYDEMDKLVKMSDIVITHGGPGSIFHVIQHGKVPIVVPRNPELNEHVDDHQILFVKRLESNLKVIGVYDIDCLKDSINKYSELRKKCKVELCNSKTFIYKFNEIINSRFKIK